MDAEKNKKTVKTIVIIVVSVLVGFALGFLTRGQINIGTSDSNLKEYENTFWICEDSIDSSEKYNFIELKEYGQGYMVYYYDRGGFNHSITWTESNNTIIINDDVYTIEEYNNQVYLKRVYDDVKFILSDDSQLNSKLKSKAFSKE